MTLTEFDPLFRDFTDALLQPAQVAVKRRQGTITAVTGGFPVTVTVTIGGMSIPGVRVLSGYAPVTGDVVMVDFNGPDPMVIGSTAGTSAGAGGPVTLGYVENLGHNTNVTTEPTDVPGMAVTFTVPAGRRIRVTAKQHLASTVAGDRVTIRVAEGGTELNAVFLTMGLANAGEDLYVSHVLTPAAGTHTYKLQGGRSAGTGTVTTYTSPPIDSNYLLVEDITGNPAPYNPASVPAGALAYAEFATNQAGITTEVDITNLSVNVVVPAGRTLKITVHLGDLISTVANDGAILRVKIDGTEIGEQTAPMTVVGQAAGMDIVTWVSPTAGAHVIKATMQRFAGTGSITVQGGALARNILIVEDVTPTPAPASGAPGSTLGYAEATANQGSITAEVDLTGLAVSVTVPAGRRIRITGQALWNSGSASPTINMRIKEGATELNEWQVTGSPAIGNGFSVHVQATISPAAGTHTYKLTGFATASSTMLAGVSFPAFILVEDITGAVWPVGAAVTAGMVASEAWTAFTPALLQGATPVTATVTYAKYQRIGRLINAQITLAVTGTGVAANTVLVALPVAAAAPNNTLIGSGEVIDASAGLAYRGLAKISGSNCFLIPTDSQVNNTIGATDFTAALASGDNISVNLTYEAAA